MLNDYTATRADTYHAVPNSKRQTTCAKIKNMHRRKEGSTAGAAVAIEFFRGGASSVLADLKPTLSADRSI